jgi:hypothetical protein
MKKFWRLMILVGMLLMAQGCTSGQDQTYTDDIEDMDLVVTAQQGRIQNLEKEVSDLKLSVEQLQQQIAGIGANTGTDESLLLEMRAENEKMVRLFFQSISAGLTEETISAMLSAHDHVYALSKDETGEFVPFWVTGGNQRGEVYVFNIEDQSVKLVDTFDGVQVLSWSPGHTHFIIETKVDEKERGYIFQLEGLNLLGSFEYTGIPHWGDRGVVYLNENPSVLYTGTQTQQMYSTGVFMYSLTRKVFETIDAGGNDYYCADLSIDHDGTIKYVRVNKDDTQSFLSVDMK